MVEGSRIEVMRYISRVVAEFRVLDERTHTRPNATRSLEELHRNGNIVRHIVLWRVAVVRTDLKVRRWCKPRHGELPTSDSQPRRMALQRMAGRFISALAGPSYWHGAGV